jgi:UDP-GlcNAc:undecaprenyl-phosphate/decaprenyl-phosphate GlcNAc-1-phosphate transferase
MIISILIAFFLSLIAGFALTPFTIVWAKKNGLVDNPKKRPHPAHTHKGIIPRAGGLPVFMGIFIPLVFILPITKQIAGIIIGAAALVIAGIWDDKKDRSPYLRFFINCLASLIVVCAGIGIPFITSPLGGVIHLDSWKWSIEFLGLHNIFIIADIFAFLWILWTTNIIGWSGGVDGQLPGFVSIAAIVIGLLSLRFVAGDPGQIQVTILAFLTAGAFLGFLPWNFYPQKIMPGYGGKTLAGFMLAVLSILAYTKLGTALLILAIPMTDAVFIIIRRLFSGRSPVWGTSNHLHHQLLKLGWGKRRIAFFYWSITAAAGIFALILNSKQKVFVGILGLISICALLVWINFFRKISRPITE